MSNHNNIYNILNSFNKVAQEPQKPAPKAAKPKSQLQEGMEQVLQRKLIAEKKAKPDYIDLDKDGNRKESMKKAAADAKAKKHHKEEDLDEAEEMEEGILDTVKKVGGKVLDKLGHGSDEDLIRDLQKKAGVPQTGKKPQTIAFHKSNDVDDNAVVGKVNEEDYSNCKSCDGCIYIC